MSRLPEKTKPHGGNREASGNTTAWASDSGVKHNPAAMSTAILALAATDAACAQLDRYAMATDCPPWEAVEAADLLDAARDLLAKGGNP